VLAPQLHRQPRHAQQPIAFLPHPSLDPDFRKRFQQSKNNSTAGSAVIQNEGGSAAGAGGGYTQFLDNSNAGNSTIYDSGGINESEGKGGMINFADSSSAGTSSIYAEGGIVGGGEVCFGNNATAAQSTLYAEFYPGGGYGTFEFQGSASGGTARLVGEGGAFDFSGLSSSGISVGSIEGSGYFELGSKNLTFDSLNTDTIVSGSIQDGGSEGGTGGSITKVGTGTVTLTGNSNYTGGTKITDGTLLANGYGSTGTGSVDVSGGNLGGTGTITPSGVSSGNAVAIASGGTLNQSVVSGGLGISTLTFTLLPEATVNLLSGAKLAFDLGVTGVNDQVDITGGKLTLNGQNFSDFNFTIISDFTGTGTYDLISTDSSGDILGSLGTSIGTVGGHDASLSVVNAQDLELTITPEPSTWNLLLGGLGLSAILQLSIRRGSPRLPSSGTHMPLHTDYEI
jgi:autotransporter-associated beta strand protein